MHQTRNSIEIPLNGETIIIETGILAKQANGAVTLKFRNLVILAVAVARLDDQSPRDFLPLSVDYQEKFASNGRIPGGFLKREGPLSTHEILVCRLVDRAIRPLFPEGYFCETQLIIQLVSADETVSADSLACLAASAALAVSDIPVKDYVSEVRVARIGGVWKINPDPEHMESADLNLMVGGTERAVMMVEGEAKEVKEDDVVEAISLAHQVISEMCVQQKKFSEAAGKPKAALVSPENDLQLDGIVLGQEHAVLDILINTKAKSLREEKLQGLFEDILASISEPERAQKKEYLKKSYKSLVKKVMRGRVLSSGIRLDGRSTDEIRPIYSVVDYLPSTHGSAVFIRGETQSLTSVTLGSSKDEQLIDSAMEKGFNNFMLHYNFPGFSTGEVKFLRGASRREIGHGNLAQRSLRQVIPTDFPYTIRIVSDILESNGSSSMATVCAGSLALMDAGVPIERSVSGVAMGLITEGDHYAILSDISADEDHLGDMDFKVTGSRKGICGCQMDLKNEGIGYELMLKALLQAKKSRLHILDKMDETLDKPKMDFKPHVPRIEHYAIFPEDIGLVIGPGGKIIQDIQATTGATLSIKEEGDKAWVEIYAEGNSMMTKVKQRLKNILQRPEKGQTYEGTVKALMPFGAFVEIMPGKDGLLHISEIAVQKISKVEDVLKVGDKLEVQLIDIDRKTGKFKLSRKSLLKGEEV